MFEKNTLNDKQRYLPLGKMLKLALCSALPRPGLGARGFDSDTENEEEAPGGTNRGFFTALPKS